MIRKKKTDKSELMIKDSKWLVSKEGRPVMWTGSDPEQSLDLLLFGYRLSVCGCVCVFAVKEAEGHSKHIY